MREQKTVWVWNSGEWCFVGLFTRNNKGNYISYSRYAGRLRFFGQPFEVHKLNGRSDIYNPENKESESKHWPKDFILYGAPEMELLPGDCPTPENSQIYQGWLPKR